MWQIKYKTSLAHCIIFQNLLFLVEIYTVWYLCKSNKTSKICREYFASAVEKIMTLTDLVEPIKHTAPNKPYKILTAYTWVFIWSVWTVLFAVAFPRSWYAPASLASELGRGTRSTFCKEKHYFISNGLGNSIVGERI